MNSFIDHSKWQAFIVKTGGCENMRTVLTLAVVTMLFGSTVAVSQTLPPAKQAIENQYAQERAAGAQNPAPKNPNAPYPIAPELPLETGILEDCSPPFAAQDFTVQSCWQGMENNIEATVYSGADPRNPQQGLVIIAPQANYPDEGSTQRVLTPVQAGAVRIAAAQNGTLLLVSATGSYVLTLNVSTGTFTSVTVVPLTPVPTNQITVSASGLAYSRESQSFNGTVTVKNIGTSSIQVPLQVVFNSLTAGVTLVNATDITNGSPYITAPAVSILGPGNQIVLNVQFKNSSNAAIKFTPAVYSGSFD